LEDSSVEQGSREWQREGIMVLVREKEGRFIQLEKEDPDKQFV
jgi:hypothetical protein